MSIIRSLPADFQQYLKNPDGLTEAFMRTIAKNNLQFSNSKTIAKVVRFDTKTAAANQRQFNFFDGTVAAAFPFNTNVQGATKPDSEHDIYYAMRILTRLDKEEQFEAGIIDPLMQLGNVTFTTNGVIRLRNVPLSEFLGQPATVTEMEQGVFLFDMPIIWPGQTSVELTVNFADPVPVGSEMRIDLIGLGLIS
jgi:hypothetical protein